MAKTVSVWKAPVPKDEPFVQLTLSFEEAAALYDVCWNISGTPESTRRGIFSGTLRSLSAQLEPLLKAVGYVHQPVRGNISF